MSTKRSYTDMAADTEQEPNNALMFDPSSPLYPYAFIDDLVEQHKARQQGTATTNPHVVCCPRAYEESFLREPLADERACINGDSCEGLKVPCKTPFVLREFVYPQDAKEQATTTAPSVRTMCLLCRRFHIAKLFFHFESMGKDLPPSQVAISQHYNVIGVPGEYCIEDCIVSHGRHTGLIMPVVLHVRSAYVLCIKQGVKHYLQTHLSDPGNPHHTCAFLTKGVALQAKEAAAHSNSEQGCA